MFGGTNSIRGDSGRGNMRQGVVSASINRRLQFPTLCFARLDKAPVSEYTTHCDVFIDRCPVDLTHCRGRRSAKLIQMARTCFSILRGFS